MTINIIHLRHREDRMNLLLDELKQQGITDYRIWDGIINNSIIPRGISQAHKQIVRYAEENSLSEILIAEDDLKFTGRGSFDFFLKNKPQDFDLYLASIYYGKLNLDNTVNDFAGLTFYIINEKYFDTFLSIPEHDNIDRLAKNTGKFVVCNPFTVIQKNGFSDNVGLYSDYSDLLTGRKLFRQE
ncbi:hypothetical protein BH10BAC2_BH10BAC2_40690 [soil metagenome]